MKRIFMIGDEWLYYKLYTGTKISDFLLTEVIPRLIEHLFEDQLIKKWFFIRYNDPDYHIRIRFLISRPDDLGKIITSVNSFLKEYIVDGTIWKLQVDTYKREIERYGLNTMVYSEDIFFCDSKMITSFLGLIEGDEGEEYRWLFGLKAIDVYLESFGYTLARKIDFMKTLKNKFTAEFGGSNFLIKQINNKYRIEKQKIFDFFDNIENDDDYREIYQILETASHNLKLSAVEIIAIKQPDKIDNINESYIHMMMNRLFTSSNRTHEMVCYEFMYKYYMNKSFMPSIE